MNPVQRAGVVPVDRDARLRQTAVQLEGLFVQRMFTAMRDTVPQDGMVAKSNAESTFGALLDEKLAEQVPSQWSGAHSLAEALYRQLRNRVDAPAADAEVPQSLTSPLPLPGSTVSSDQR